MTPLGLFIFLALLGEYALETAATILNLRALREPPPHGFEDVYPPDAYRRSQDYTRARSAFGLVTSAFDLAVVLLFWLAGGFPMLNRAIAGLGWHPLLAGLLYIGILLLVRALLALPFTLYSTFVIEARFGFNKTTPRTFLADSVKGLFLSLLLGGPLLAGVLALFSYMGPTGWLYCWGGTTLFILAMQYVAPTWIMPLFNKFTPLEDGPLREAIVGYARSVRFAVDNILVMDGSKRSTKANAFFTGFGKRKRIALFDTLIRAHSVAELVAVLAHEIGHYKRRHILQGIVLSIIHAGVMFFLLSLVLHAQSLYAAFFMERMPVHAGLIFFGLLFSPAEFLLGILFNWHSRRNEYQADRWSAETTGHPGDMISALKSLARENLSQLTPHRLSVILHYSHPPVPERVSALRSLTN